VRNDLFEYVETRSLAELSVARVVFIS